MKFPSLKHLALRPDDLEPTGKLSGTIKLSSTFDKEIATKK